MKKKISIGIIAPRFDIFGGGEVLLLKLIGYLEKRNKYTITFYCPDVSLRGIQHFAKSNVNFKLLDVVNEKTGRYTYEISQYNEQINAHDLYITNHIEMTQLKVFPKISYVHEPLRLANDNFDEEPFWSEDHYKNDELDKFETIQSTSLKYAQGVSSNFLPDLVLTNSIQTKKELKKTTILKNIEVIYPGHTAKKNKEAKRRKWKFDEKNMFNVIFLGAIAYHKKPEFFISLAIKNPHINFKMIGDGPEYEAKSMDNSTCQLQNFEMLGPISDEELNTHYLQADCLINVSIREPFGMNMLEAASYGIPIIASKNSGASEILKDALIEVNYNINQISLKLNQLINDYSYYNNISQKLINISKIYTWDNFGKIFDQKINKVLSKYKKIKKPLKNVNLIYLTDKRFNRDEFDVDNWGGHMPIVGRYFSESKNIIIEHLKQIKALKFDKISFYININKPFKDISKQFLVIERIARISLVEKFDFKFNYLIDSHYQDMSKGGGERNSLKKIINMVKKINYSNLYINDNIEIILNSPNYRFLKNATTNVKNIKLFDSASFIYVDNIKDIQKNSGKDIIFNSFNSFHTDKFLEKIVK